MAAFAATAFVTVRWLGIAYLAFLGVRALLDHGTGYALEGPTGERRAFWLGLTTQLANPKVDPVLRCAAAAVR